MVALSGDRQPRPQPVKQHLLRPGQSVSSVQELLQGAKVCSTFLLGQTPDLAAGGKSNRVTGEVCPGHSPLPTSPGAVLTWHRLYALDVAAYAAALPVASALAVAAALHKADAHHIRGPRAEAPLGWGCQTGSEPHQALPDPTTQPNHGCSPSGLWAGSNRHPCPPTPEELRAGMGVWDILAGPCG